MTVAALMAQAVERGRSTVRGVVNEIGRYDVDWIEIAPYVEDIEPLPGTRWLVAASMWNPSNREPGRLYLVNTDNGRVSEGWPGSGTVASSDGLEINAPVEPEQFAPHGVAIGAHGGGDGSWNLYAVHHRARESIEMFRITLEDDGAPTIAWTGAVARRPDSEGNAVAPLPDGGFIASYYTPGLTFRPELHDGRTNGGVERWTPDEGWTAIPGLDGAFPNGVAVSADCGTYFLADTFGGLRRTTAGGEDLTHIPLALAPDNLKWGKDGRLLTTGVRTSTLDGVFAAAMADPPEPLQVVVVAIDPTTLEVETLLDEHVSFGLPTTALVIGSDLYLTSLFGKRLARLRARS